MSPALRMVTKTMGIGSRKPRRARQDRDVICLDKSHGVGCLDLARRAGSRRLQRVDGGEWIVEKIRSG